jgi:hemerythrin
LHDARGRGAREKTMGLRWDPKLSVGVRSIDDQHQELFRQVNGLLDAMGEGKGKQAAGDVLRFLADYVTQHFAMEQKLMAQHRYSGLAAHKAEHDDFVKTFRALQAEFEEKGPTMSFTVNVNRLVCAWLRQHIGTTDAALGRFLSALKTTRATV